MVRFVRIVRQKGTGDKTKVSKNIIEGEEETKYKGEQKRRKENLHMKKRSRQKMNRHKSQMEK